MVTETATKIGGGKALCKLSLFDIRKLSQIPSNIQITKQDIFRRITISHELKITIKICFNATWKKLTDL